MAKRNRGAQAKKGAPQPVEVAATQEASSTPSRKERLREAAAAKRRRQTMTLYGVGALLALAAVFLVGWSVYRARPVVGEQVLASQGNLHIPIGTAPAITYNSTPPTSGPHYELLASWGILRELVRYEHLVHNLEDGGVVIYYQCPDGCPELIGELSAVIDPFLATGRRVVLAPNDPTWRLNDGYAPHQDMGAPIALTAWRRILKMETVDADVIGAFIERYEGIDNHRPGGT